MKNLLVYTNLISYVSHFEQLERGQSLYILYCENLISNINLTKVSGSKFLLLRNMSKIDTISGKGLHV